NLSYDTDDASLKNCFSSFGQVTDSIVMVDRDTGRSRGFGFVTFSTDDEAQNAINEMNERELDGRRLRVNMANARPGGGGGGGGGGGYRGGGGGGYNSGGGGGMYAFLRRAMTHSFRLRGQWVQQRQSVYFALWIASSLTSVLADSGSAW
ncbi:hypothetical protein B0H12DRAFT_1026372, partial [Mycena haematopus]